jgi:uncharacterized protein YlxW (UPF0749 family)
VTPEPTRHRGSLHRSWHVGAALVFVAAGALFATTSLSAKGLDLRAASITDLAGVVRQERQRADELQSRAADLTKEVDDLSHQVNDAEVAELQDEVEALSGPAGLQAVAGPGLTVTLDDAPKSEIDKARADSGVSIDELALVVHQQDIQAVVNALWGGGAEAMTINGQRVVSTTGIKCVGNTVVLHGIPYSPPYRIAAIGNPADLEAGLNGSDYIEAYLDIVAAYDLGYDVTTSGRLELPAFEGSTALEYAKAGDASSRG